jgi:hypothetical protein
MEKPKSTQQAVEYRIVCLFIDGTQLQLKSTRTLEEAVSIIKNLDPKPRFFTFAAIPSS